MATLLVISDIHGNWPALQAIREEADAVVCLGDIVSYGPFPRECVAWVREHAAYVIRGNHDTALSQGVDPGAAPHKRALALAKKSKGLNRDYFESRIVAEIVFGEAGRPQHRRRRRMRTGRPRTATRSTPTTRSASAIRSRASLPTCGRYVMCALVAPIALIFSLRFQHSSKRQILSANPIQFRKRCEPTL